MAGSGRSPPALLHPVRVVACQAARGFQPRPRSSPTVLIGPAGPDRHLQLVAVGWRGGGDRRGVGGQIIFQGRGAAARLPEPRGQRRIPSAPSASLPARPRPPVPQPYRAGRQRFASCDSTASAEAPKE
jgi:hypothetical protein